MTGISLFIGLIVTIVVMIFAISKLKIHPFIAILAVSLIFGLAAGIPLVTIKTADGVTVYGIADIIGQGFSGIFNSIGIVIIFGALIGLIIESTGAAYKLADMIIKLVGKKNPVLALQLMGWVVAIPVFCDSGFVILDPIRKALIKKTRASSVSMTMALSLGLYVPHVLIPPSPGPIAAAQTLGLGDNLILVIGFGALCSIPAMIGAYFFAKFIGTKIKSKEDIEIEDTVKDYEEIIKSFDKLPGGFISWMPIIIPIILMAMGSIFDMNNFSGVFGDFIRFAGTPIIALGIGVLFAVYQLALVKKMDKFYEITNDTLKLVGPILFITATGGVLGRVIVSTDIIQYIRENAAVLSTIGIFFPFVLTAIIKTAQGSATVSMVLTAGIIYPMLDILGLDSPTRTALCVMAIASGSLIVSHANGSYFWLVTNMGGMTPQQGYKTQTLGSFVLGVCSMTGVFILSLIF
jgi:GntP family gluconate:H+ symporter